MKTSFFLPAVIVAGITFTGCTTNERQREIRKTDLSQLKKEVRAELTGNLLPYWSTKMIDTLNGGFYGRVDEHEKVYPDADKGGILNARILWTFSSAYRVLKDSAYLQLASYAKDYILQHFIDGEDGGAYMTVKADGSPGDMRKQTLTESYFIYALSEYYRATGDKESLNLAKNIFELLEMHALDHELNGYFEVFTRDWQRSPDLLLGERSPEDEKTMITHLHLVEAYAGLYRVWPDQRMASGLRNVLNVFNDKIVDAKTGHLIYFLNRSWNGTTEIDSYGHDIEASWLIHEAAGLLKDPDLENSVRALSIKIANAASEGLQEDGSMLTEMDRTNGHVVTIRSWWEQAETVVGYLNAFEITDDPSYLDKSLNSWNYIKKHFVDRNNGGWYRFVLESGEPGSGNKADFWTCPYHDGRMCLEVIERIDS